MYTIYRDNQPVAFYNTFESALAHLKKILAGLEYTFTPAGAVLKLNGKFYDYIIK